jgi:hypothetical protein
VTSAAKFLRKLIIIQSFGPLLVAAQQMGNVNDGLARVTAFLRKVRLIGVLIGAAELNENSIRRPGQKVVHAACQFAIVVVF